MSQVQHIPMDWSEMKKIKKWPSITIVKDAMKIGIKECYTEEEMKKLNRYNDIDKVSKGDIYSFVLFCHEVYDKMLIENYNHANG